MKAAWYIRQGAAGEVLELGEMDLPLLKANEVLVKIYASGINPSDVKRRQGNRGGMEYTRVIPHSDGAGVIEAVGSNVAADCIGERVWIYNGQWNRAYGTAAEYITLAASLAIPLPRSTDFSTAACLGIPAFTAYRAVFSEGAVKGKVILVSGGAGAVGNFAIQMAKWGGAKVIATVSSEEKAQVAAIAGADIVLNYKTQDIAAQVMMLTGSGVDHIVEVDFGGNLAINEAVLKVNGSIATYASMGNPTPTILFYPLLLKSVSIRLIYVYDLPADIRQEAIDDINQMLSEGCLKTTIAARFALTEIVAAHQLVESGKIIGNVIIDRF